MDRLDFLRRSAAVIGGLALGDGLLSQMPAEAVTAPPATLPEPPRFYNSIWPVGSIRQFAPLPPNEDRWMKPEGQWLHLKRYPDLFSIVGYTYGKKGKYYRLPDVRGRVHTASRLSTHMHLLSPYNRAHMHQYVMSMPTWYIRVR